MKRPLLIVALFHAGGVLAGDWLPFTASPFALLGVAIGLGLLCLGIPRWRPGLLAAVVVLAGVANLRLRTSVIAPDDLRVLFPEDAAIVTVRGVLTETPYHRVYDHEGEITWRTLAEIELSAVKRQRGDWTRASGRIMASTSGVVPEEFFGGRTVEIEGVLRRPQRPLVQGQFDYRTYLQRHGIHFQLHVQATNDWKLAPGVAQPATPPVADRFAKWAMILLGRGLPVDESLRLLWAMTLGWKTALTGEVSEPFMRSGTMHIFAISGLHIALIAGILVLVLRAFRVPRIAVGWVVIPLLWFYTGVTGWQASAIRSTIMMSIILAGWALKRPSDLLNSLAAAAFVILLWEPQQLFQASFQLSFCVVLSLALFGPVLDRVRQKLLAEDPLLPRELYTSWQKLRRRLLGWATTGIVTSLAAWLGSIPLVAYYFNLFTPISLLANLLVVPLSSMALAANIASLVVGSFLPGVAELFNHTAWFAMGLMVKLSHWAGQLPGGCFYTRTPGLAAFALYYGTLCSVMAGWLKLPRARWWVATGLAALLVAWALPVWKARHDTRITIIPLSGGEAVCVDAPGKNSDLLIDCGNRGSAEFVLKPFLRAQGLNRLAAVVLTHGDINNVGGAEFLLHQFRVGSIVTGSTQFRSAAYRQLTTRLGARPGFTRQIERGARLGPWTALHPDPADKFPQADDGALVLFGEPDGTRLLLLSDLGKPGQHALLARHPTLDADIIVSGIPARGEPLADALLEAAAPQAVIVADSVYPATARAGPRLRERLAARREKVFFTSETGALTIVLRGSEWRIEDATGAVLWRGGERVTSSTGTNGLTHAAPGE